LGILKAIEVVGGVLTIFGVAVGATGGAAIMAGLVGVAGIIMVGLFVSDRCIQGDGLRNCIAGVVNEIVGSFSETSEDLFPFTAMHDRLDIVVKSRYWPLVEASGAYVFCVDTGRGRSEVMRVYYFNPQVCNAAKGALYGSVAGAVVGIVIAAILISGCATIILCLLALLLAAIIAAVAVLAGAFVGGQIGKAASSDLTPDDSTLGTTLRTGDLVTVVGNTQKREHDLGANVIWWESSTSLHGHVTDGTPQPFSHCDIDEQLATDSCGLPPVPKDQEPPPIH
jgi:hypothetical protein